MHTSINNCDCIAGVPDDKIAAVLPLTKTVEIEVDGDNYTLSGALGSKVFPVNKEIEEKFAEHISKVSSYIIVVS